VALSAARHKVYKQLGLETSGSPMCGSVIQEWLVFSPGLKGVESYHNE